MVPDIDSFWLVPVAFLTSTVAGIFGLGGGVLLIVLMPGFVPAGAIIPLHAVVQLASNASRAGFGIGHIDTGIIPQEQRIDDAVFMTPEHVAGEVVRLFLTEESGATWAKVSESKPAWVMYPPGRKSKT